MLRLRIPNDSARRPYDSEFIPGYQRVVELDKPFDRQVQGQFEYVPDLSASWMKGDHAHDALPLVLEGEQTAFAGKLKCEAKGAVMMSRCVQVLESGRYLISLQTKAKAFVRLHEAGIIDADFKKDQGVSTEIELNLGDGYHPFSITGVTGEGNEIAVKLNFKRLGSVAK